MNKPFLKWAGSKRKIIEQLKKHIGSVEGRLIEPFVGSGTVFLNIIAAGGYLLADLNKDLINLFAVLQKEQKDFVDYVKETYFNDKMNDSDIYYDLRKTFNDTTDIRERAALFVYLNRHAFNGLCRYNKGGGFNVPYGKYNTVHFPNYEMQEFASHANADKVEFFCQDFTKTMAMAKEGDTIYCDPPYAPLSTTSNFTGYCADGFPSDFQNKLAKLAEESKARVLISNNCTSFTSDLYKNASDIILIDVQKSIGSKSETRKKTKELIAIFN